MTTVCAGCGYPLRPGALAVPVVRIGDDGEPTTGVLDWAHRHCFDLAPGTWQHAQTSQRK